ncbi:MAG: DUF2202 domain-containing protein [Dehalococcoidales bacterium]|nr:DUF2202 domain-containing protein [Dehalococcoidales bacterium]
MALVTLTAVVLIFPLGVSAVAAGNSVGGGNPGPVQVTPLSPAEIEDLTFLREEEKLDRDVYLELYDTWQLPIFNNIAASEQKHMDAIKRLLDKYGIADPALEQGVFTESSGLQSLYDELIEKGIQSRVDAFEVGVIIEEKDIADLEEAILRTLHVDIETVYNNLLQGSLNHLAAFNSHLN